MVSVAVISSIYGRHDEPIPQPVQDMACDWLMVSDREDAPEPWTVIHEPRPQLHPRMAAKVAKCRPDLYTDAEVTIWIDGNVLVDADFVSWCLSSLGSGVLAQHHAMGRNTITSEAMIAASMRKYQELPINPQTDTYLAEGHPDDWGLWWTGLIVRTKDCPRFGDEWLTEMLRWTYEDQISEPVVLRRWDIRPTNIDIDWTFKKFSLRGHRDQS